MAIAAIVADDFSSATDCGVQFASRGLDAVALLGSPARRLDYEVASIDTDTRPLPAGEAYARVRKAAELVKNSGYSCVYKSVDSTLRGNLGAEIDAMLDVLRPGFAFVAPAFPFWGRTTVNGYHFLNGVPISETQFSRDPAWPIREPSLVRLLAAQTRRGVGLVELALVRGETRALAARLAALKTEGKEVIVFDAETEDDLKRIARIGATAGRGNLIVGSTGLSQYLADAWGISRGARAELPAHGQGPVVLVSGSASPTTRRQIERYCARQETFDLGIDPQPLMAAGAVAATVAKHAGAIRSAADAGHDIAIYLRSTPENVRATQEAGAAAGLDKLEVSNILVSTLARLAAALVERVPVAGLILTGGDTAKAVCERLGASGMRLLREVEPGIPLGVLVGPHEVPVVTKAGAFGSEDALDRARGVLRGVERQWP